MATVVSRPDAAYMSEYMGLDAAAYPETAVQAALDTATAEIDALCITDPYEAPLREATCRRAQAILTARGAPLGQLDGGAFGFSAMIRYDPELGKLLAHYLRGPFA